MNRRGFLSMLGLAAVAPLLKLLPSKSAAVDSSPVTTSSGSVDLHYDLATRDDVTVIWVRNYEEIQAALQTLPASGGIIHVNEDMPAKPG